MTTFTGTSGADLAIATGGGTLTGFTGGTAAQLTDATGDIFLGLGGNDIVVAGSGNDTLRGEAGNDRLDGGDGINGLNGGAGQDVFVATRSAVAANATTITDFGSRYFVATLNGVSQNPDVVTAAAGASTFVLNRAQTVLTASTTTTGLDFGGAGSNGVIDFHLHAGAPEVNGPVVWNIRTDMQTAVNTTSESFTSVWTSGEGLTAQLPALLSGQLYENIHTNAHAGGEIRGQVLAVAGDTGADRIDLTAFNIGSLAAFQAVTADVAGSARMATLLNGFVSTLTISGVLEASLTAADFIFVTGTAADTINGATAADDLFGAGGADRMNGLSGNDRLFGESGNDILEGGEGADMLIGGLDADTLRGGNGNDRLFGESGNDVLEGGEGTDMLVGGIGTDTLRGGNGNDIYELENGADTVSDTGGTADLATSTVTRSLLAGGLTTVERLTLLGVAAAGGIGNNLANLITGNAAANTLDGQAGNDTLLGLAGNDVLVGGLGRDTQTGGVGNDSFRFAATHSPVGANADIILDFDDSGDDRIDLSAVFGGTLTYRHNLAFTAAGQVRINDVAGADVLVEVNTGGTLAADMQIRLAGTTLASMAAADFVL